MLMSKLSHTPRTNGRVEVCWGGDTGLDRHYVQIHQVVEVQMEDAAICGNKADITTNPSLV